MVSLQPVGPDVGPYRLRYRDELPGFLYPQLGASLQPPVYHYGWTVDEPWILDYAKKHGLLVVSVGRQGIHGPVSDTSPHEVLDDRGNRVFKGGTIANVCRDIKRRAALGEGSTLQLRYEVVFGQDMNSSEVCFAICQNYHQAYRHTIMAPDMRKVKALMGRPDFPQWHLDFLESEWEERHPT